RRTERATRTADSNGSAAGVRTRNSASAPGAHSQRSTTMFARTFGAFGVLDVGLGFGLHVGPPEELSGLGDMTGSVFVGSATFHHWLARPVMSGPAVGSPTNSSREGSLPLRGTAVTVTLAFPSREAASADSSVDV